MNNGAAAVITIIIAITIIARGAKVPHLVIIIAIVYPSECHIYHIIITDIIIMVKMVAIIAIMTQLGLSSSSS